LVATDLFVVVVVRKPSPMIERAGPQLKLLDAAAPGSHLRDPAAALRM